ncbi:MULTISPECIES: glycosyltransferase family 4 protein [Candidatus Microthrix]|jgi:phosphatidylinositol alpha-mannosyltransferase|uniref:Putative GDP-mannose-dependent alpha-(1-2)-phosphatidylinositol mannosyltransferase n=1 Tax=Candidatus Neomicrothrix parvicella RN1 TaxID=1229780 RepID=R4Z261_9ACTN|nr:MULTISPECIES: glycosyltransferase family 4 protein [Microthrix]MBL0205043.1 glycosyltransferase family 4 protein [Candidatus Microthrix sp.]MBP7851317.1 glycosyltransferase family 4 protein [Candidatus Microthrix sp.]MBP7876647.1 glycosyltransferase family 4 protein [Candidatus Microthrix sp.]CCM65034.1 putative GDP-mannose-dependent alpha-(1-2)-phosphatidylinositol mannosyltransferase [Candidatus Microthrix parvicella RN1]
MRIGLVCPYSLSVPGGVQGQVLGLARALRRRGHEVRVLAPCDGPPPEPGVTPLGASIPFATNGSVAPLAPDLSAQLRVMRAVWDEDFDVLHLHEPLVPGITNTALVVKPCPMVGTFHASGDFSAYSSWLRPLGSWAVRRLDVRVAVSDDARSTAGVWFDDDDMLVLFNAVDTEAFARVTPHEAEGPSIFFVGRHETRKGLAVLLEAMKQLPQDVSLWVAGTGPLTDELQASTVGDDRIEWLGRLSDAERDARMAGATVFCAPAIGGESFGVVLLEAMAAGTPVVASNIPGYTNVGTHDRNALLAEPDDPTALAKALNAVLGDQALAKRLVVAGHQRANAYSMERLAASYEQLYRDAMARTPAAG